MGAGLIGKEHIRRINNKLKNASVAAINDIDKEMVLDFMKEENFESIYYDSSKKLIHSNEVDAIIITSWGETHEELVLECLKAEKPVFCEKPLATTLEGCKKIVETELKIGKNLVQVGYMRRFDQSYRMLKEAVRNNDFGSSLIIRCSHRLPSHPRNSGNMAITEASVHEIDIIRWLLNDEFISAQVLLPKSTSAVNKGVQDPHLLILETTKGLVAEIEVFVNSKYGYDISCHIVSEEGILYLPEPMNLEYKRNFQRSKAITKNWKERFDEAYDKEIQCWLDNARMGNDVSPSSWDGYMVALTMDACLKAKETNQKVEIPLMETPQLYKSED